MLVGFCCLGVGFGEYGGGVGFVECFVFCFVGCFDCGWYCDCFGFVGVWLICLVFVVV